MLDTDDTTELIRTASDHMLERIILYRQGHYLPGASTEIELVREEQERRAQSGELRHPSQPVFEHMNPARLGEEIAQYERTIETIRASAYAADSPEYLNMLESQYMLTIALAEQQGRAA